MHCEAVREHRARELSLVADLIGQKLGDYVITESGFGSDMGMEKFFDIVTEAGSAERGGPGGDRRALKHHGGLEDDPRADSKRRSPR